MQPPVVTKNPTAVQAEVQKAFLAGFPNADPRFVPQIFGWAIQCFAGGYKDYHPVDVPYHDFEHTLQGTLCLARLLQRRQAAGAQPSISQKLFELGLLAILLHDTGYLKRGNDTEGTGAKYTMTHVNRSADFAGALLKERGFDPGDIKAVQNMIHCTGLDAALSVIPFQSEQEKIVGCALGTSDLLGQMAADDYVEKLHALYSEFAEAARHSKGKTHFVALYSSAEDLMRKTPDFWEKFVQGKLDHDFGGLYRFLSIPYPDGPNEYLDRIDANIERLRQQLAMAAHR
jgi:hypothetical protein